MRPDSAQAVRDIIIDRLIAGWYPKGGKLPSANDLAHELGVHRNTAAKAYQLLADLGIVTTKRGRGTYVSALAVHGNQQNLLSTVHDSLEKSIRQARRIGVARDELEETLDQYVRSVYESEFPRGVFVECNLPDTEAHVHEIASATKVRLEPLLLEEVPRHFEQDGNATGIVFTSLFHYRELCDLLAEIQPKVPVVGLHTIPSEISLEKIASIPDGTKVGVITGSPAGSNRIASLVTTYSQAETVTCSSPTEEEIVSLSRETRVLVCTRDQEPVIRRLEVPVPVIPIPFQVSQDSAARVLDSMLDMNSRN